VGRLQDKVCLITGAARGQGAAEARLFAAEGAQVWLTDVLDAEGQSLAAEVGGEYRHLDVRDARAKKDRPSCSCSLLEHWDAQRPTRFHVRTYCAVPSGIRLRNLRHF